MYIIDRSKKNLLVDHICMFFITVLPRKDYTSLYNHHSLTTNNNNFIAMMDNNDNNNNVKL
ncbi:hypothetical protein DERP_010489 [Dermatophagoides pteronyssinus]|uniref:Uncharacterized protein n=1 Tax=Dermatophagoides pteronyssinus TaxID=6956 RepID=A0ABQ8JFZ7_DERPT|nr:hypothetical protein DERP_010489 [Dermatophagoides pteronyssinus]